MPGTRPGMTSWWTPHCTHPFIVRLSAPMPPRPELGPKSRLGYTDSRLERAAELRTDDAALARLAADARAGAYVIGGDLIVIKQGSPLNDPLFTMAEARALGSVTETVFLGCLLYTSPSPRDGLL